MRRLIFIFCATVTMAACAWHGLEERQAFLAQFVGQSETKLVQAFGVPSRSIETGGHRFLAYIERRLDMLPGTYGGPWSPWWGGGFGGFPPEVVERRCETTFELTEGIVRGFALRGNACG